MSEVISAPAPVVDLSAVKTKQQVAWSSGDYAVVGTTLQIVGESLCEALDLHAGEHVLDVAAGNGNATLAAARRWCDVTSTDYVPALLERGRTRASAPSSSALTCISPRSMEDNRMFTLRSLIAVALAAAFSFSSSHFVATELSLPFS